MKDPERCANSNESERRISHLVKELNNVSNTRTFGSCQGHFGFEEPEPFNNRAYIEFRTPKGKFGQLEKAIYESINDDRCQVRFEDYLSDNAYFYGALYIIPKESLAYKEQRQIADKTINEIVKIAKGL